MYNTDIVIIGGGAAGMMAGITAARLYKSVVIVERNDIMGKKLLITGKGRCNVTNNCDNDTVMKNIPTNPRFLYSALSIFSTADTMAFFEELGVPLKTERGNRVFPLSDKSRDIVNALKNELKRLNVPVIRARAEKILTQDGFVSGVVTDKETISCNSVILATGGKSYPGTGSTGDGYKMARALGHTVTPLTPSLVPLCTKEDTGNIMGLSLKNVTVTLYDKDNKKLYFDMGEMLFTHFGVSGPLILSASAFYREGCKISIDLKPALDEKKLDSRILRDFEGAKNKNISNAMRGLLPEKLILPVLSRADISPDTKVNVITKEQRKALISILKSLTFEITGTRPIEEAIITKGGISVKEIDPKTMESKLIPGLYFAGEIIDCDAYTGGFNLQIAFSTAYLSGINA